LVYCSPSHLEEVESILKEFGSEEIKINGAPVVEEKILDTKEEEAPKEESKAEEAPQEEVATIEDEKDED
jgi:hypothetical protein